MALTINDHIFDNAKSALFSWDADFDICLLCKHDSNVERVYYHEDKCRHSVEQNEVALTKAIELSLTC